MTELLPALLSEGVESFYRITKEMAPKLCDVDFSGAVKYECGVLAIMAKRILLQNNGKSATIDAVIVQTTEKGPLTIMTRHEFTQGYVTQGFSENSRARPLPRPIWMRPAALAVA